MQSLFDFHEILEGVTNGVPGLGENAIDAQKVTDKEAKEKDHNTTYCIQSTVDSANFNKISHVKSTKEARNLKSGI